MGPDSSGRIIAFCHKTPDSCCRIIIFGDKNLDSSGQIKKNEVIGFAARTTGSFNLNMNTQIYGLFPFKIGKIDLIRHVASPSVGYSYRPDFSKESPLG